MGGANPMQCLDQCVPWVFTPAEIRKVKGGDTGLRAEDIVQQRGQSQGSWPSEEAAHYSDLDTSISSVTFQPALCSLCPGRAGRGWTLGRTGAQLGFSDVLHGS